MIQRIVKAVAGCLGERHARVLRIRSPPLGGRGTQRQMSNRGIGLGCRAYGRRRTEQQLHRHRNIPASPLDDISRDGPALANPQKSLICWLLVLLKPVIAQAQLYSVKLWISLAEVGVRDMPPTTADIQGLLVGGEYLNSTAASGCEIKV